MSLFDAVMSLYPTAVPGVDFELRDDSDGQGPQIVRWDADKLGKQPTAKEIQAASDAYDSAHVNDAVLDQFHALDPNPQDRAFREFSLAMMVQVAGQQGISEEQLYAINPGYRKLKDLDAQVAALRGQLK